MTWWAILFALSQLARYEPATWTSAIEPDGSALTVPIEEGLRTAKRSLPRLVYHGTTGPGAEFAGAAAHCCYLGMGVGSAAANVCRPSVVRLGTALR